MFKRVNHYLTEKQIAGLQSLAERLGLSVASLIRLAVDEFLRQRGQEDKRR